jgi:muconolactone D-isomerase
MEFLVHMEVGQLPSDESVENLYAREAQRAGELAVAGVMRRLWRVPGRRANWGIWNATTADELHEAISSLPLYPYMTITIHPLAKHPNDPGLPLS